MNSPEGAEKITEKLVEPRTYVLNGETVKIEDAATPTSAPPAETAPASSSDPTKRKRRTKAEMEAARAEGTAPPATSPVAPAASATASTGSAPAELTRIASALERIARAFELASLEGK